MWHFLKDNPKDLPGTIDYFSEDLILMIEDALGDNDEMRLYTIGYYEDIGDEGIIWWTCTESCCNRLDTERYKVVGWNYIYNSVDLDEYQKLAMRTCAMHDSHEKLMHSVFGLTSEAGEVAGLFQKSYQGHSIDIGHVVKELGDCLWMIAEMCDAIGVDMSYVAEKNIEKLKARYPEGFTSERSLNRAEGDI